MNIFRIDKLGVYVIITRQLVKELETTYVTSKNLLETG